MRDGAKPMFRGVNGSFECLHRKKSIQLIIKVSTLGGQKEKQAY